MKQLIFILSGVLFLAGCKKDPSETIWIQNNSHIPVTINGKDVADGQCVKVEKKLPVTVIIPDFQTCDCVKGCDDKELGAIGKTDTASHHIWNGQSFSQVAASEEENFINACKNWKEVRWIRNSSGATVQTPTGKDIADGQCIAMELTVLKSLDVSHGNAIVMFTDQTLKPEKLPSDVRWDEDKQVFYGHSNGVTWAYHHEWNGLQQYPRTRRISLYNADFVKSCKNAEQTWSDASVTGRGCAVAE